MIELGADSFKAMSEFENMKVLPGLKPCLLFNGPAWELNQELKQLKSLFTDFFHREKVNRVTFYFNATYLNQIQCSLYQIHNHINFSDKSVY